MAKEYTFKGKRKEEVAKMTVEELMPLMTSRARRSLRRGVRAPNQRLLKSVREHKGEKPIRTHRRDIVIVPELIGKRLAVHNGKDWNIVEINHMMVGHFLGEFSMTRKPVKHSGPGIGATRGTKFISVK